MANYDINELHKRILDILVAVDDICKHHNLRYYLWAGTMLGAVRHKGFIPWDDDIDIAMPRPDYDKFMSHAKEWLPKPLEAICAENNKKIPGGFGKVIDASTTLIERESYNYLAGIYIDVFPIDGIPSNKLIQKWQNIKYKYCSRMIYLIHRDPYKHGHGPSSWIPLICHKIYSHSHLQKMIRKIMTSYCYEKCDNVIDYDDGLNGVMRKEILGSPKKILFEGRLLNGVEHYDKYLTQKYGDYMQLPKVTERRQHNFFYLDYNTPYCEYKDHRNFSSNKK